MADPAQRSSYWWVRRPTYGRRRRVNPAAEVDGWALPDALLARASRSRLIGPAVMRRDGEPLRKQPGGKWGPRARQGPEPLHGSVSVGGTARTSSRRAAWRAGPGPQDPGVDWHRLAAGEPLGHTIDSGIAGVEAASGERTRSRQQSSGQGERHAPGREFHDEGDGAALPAEPDAEPFLPALRRPRFVEGKGTGRRNAVRLCTRSSTIWISGGLGRLTPQSGSGCN